MRHSLSSYSQCVNVLQHVKTTGFACFLQRVKNYYPTNCPHCHDCPVLALGDTFGPLEVVGFGHSIEQPCAACDQRSETLPYETSLYCRDLLQCSQSVDCTIGELLGLLLFVENQCSFGPMEVGLIGEDNHFGGDAGTFTTTELRKPATKDPMIL
jgi:hypothetical protein